MRNESITYELKDGPRRYKVVFVAGMSEARISVFYGDGNEHIAYLPCAEASSVEAERLCRDAFPMVEKTNKP